MPAETKRAKPVMSYDELKEVMIDPTLPCVTVVQILEGAKQDDSLAEWERHHAEAWLDRLVDEHGNPKDDFGRDPLQAAVEENGLGANGTLTITERREDRDVLTFIISHRARTLDREEVRETVRAHLAKLADSFVDELYDESEPAA